MSKRFWRSLLTTPYPLSDKPVREANLETINRLLAIIPEHIPYTTEKTSAKNLRWLMETCRDNINTFPVDKQGRWIGFVQGVLATRRYLDVDIERDISRKTYHEAYRLTGQAIPETQEQPDPREAVLDEFNQST